MTIEILAHRCLAVAGIKPTTVQQVMLPVTITGWVVGLGVIEYPCNNPWPVTSFLYSLALIAGYCLVVEIAMQHVKILASDFSTDTGKYIFVGLFYGNVCLDICSTLLSWCRIKGLKNIVRCLDNLDTKMEKMGIHRDYVVIYCQQLVILLIQCIIVLAFIITALTWTAITDFTIGDKIATVIALYYPLIITLVGDISFVTLVRFVGLRFRQLNDCLKSMSTTTNDSPQHKRVLQYSKLKSYDAEHTYEKKTRDDPIAMRTAREYHHELIIVSQMINDTFGIQILLSMSVSFVLITGLLYYTCNVLLWTKPSQQHINEELTNASIWLTFYIYRIFIINASCASTSASAKKTGNIICHLHEPSTRKAFRDEIRAFTLQLSHHPLTFTAYGFFTLNYGFIQGMIGSITTYLVILIQIGEMPAPNVLETTSTPALLDSTTAKSAVD